MSATMMPWKRKVASQPIFAAVTAALGAGTGILAGLYPERIKAAFPFAFGVVIVWPAVLFWVALVLFAYCFKLNIQAQNAALDDGLSRLSDSSDALKIQGDSQAAALQSLRTSTDILERLIRTLPPDGFLSQFEDYYIEAHSAAASARTATGNGAEQEIKDAIFLCVSILASLARYFDGEVKNISYAANVMLFSNLPAAPDEAAKRVASVRFVEPGCAPSTLAGVLEIVPDLAVVVGDSGIAEPDETIAAIALPVPKPEYREDHGKSTVIPGAPEAFCSPSETVVVPKVSGLWKWCKEHSGLRESVAADMERYFNEGDHVGNQLVALDHLALLVPQIFGDDPVAAKYQPLREVIELLALVGRGLNSAPELRVAQVFQREQRADNATQFPEREVKLILRALRTQPT